MNSQLIKSVPHTEKFHNAEQMWFWFLYSRTVRNGFSTGNVSPGRRICELLDVETLVTKLYLAGQLNDEQLSVMKEFGDRKRPPHQHIWAENQKAALWRTAMTTLESAAIKKGWIG
jgi:hypothetical protein